MRWLSSQVGDGEVVKSLGWDLSEAVVVEDEGLQKRVSGQAPRSQRGEQVSSHYTARSDDGEREGTC